MKRKFLRSMFIILLIFIVLVITTSMVKFIPCQMIYGPEFNSIKSSFCTAYQGLPFLIGVGYRYFGIESKFFNRLLIPLVSTLPCFVLAILVNKFIKKRV